MKKITSISKENFPAAIKYAYRLNKKMAVNAFAQYVILPIGSILFAFHALILLLGLAQMVAQDNNTTIAIVDALPFIPSYINWLWTKLGVVTNIIYLKIFMIFALLYLVPVVVCGIIRIVFSILIRGRKPSFDGTVEQKAKELYLYVAEGPLPKTDPYTLQVIWSRISGIPAILAFAASICYSVYKQTTPPKSSIWLYVVLVVIVILEVILIYILYSRLHSVLAFFMKRYYDCNKEWEGFKREADRYWLSVDSSEKQKRDEAKNTAYDGWKYRNLENTLYYKEKFNEYYAQYMGQSYENSEDKAARIAREVHDDMSGGNWGDY